MLTQVFRRKICKRIRRHSAPFFPTCKYPTKIIQVSVQPVKFLSKAHNLCLILYADFQDFLGSLSIFAQFFYKISIELCKQLRRHSSKLAKVLVNFTCNVSQMCHSCSFGTRWPSQLPPCIKKHLAPVNVRPSLDKSA